MPIHDRLQVLARRLAQLNAWHDEHTTPLNFAVGATYALGMAHALDYDDRAEAGRGQRMWDLASAIAQDLSHGRDLPRDGEWLAGYCFNNAIIRIAVSYEHIVRHVTGMHGREDINKLIKTATPLGFLERWEKAWRPMHNELNAIRHRNDFIDGPQEQVTYAFTVHSLEQLIETLTWGLKCDQTMGSE